MMGYKALVDAACRQITEYTAEQVRAKMHDDAVIVVDVRDVRELWRDGKLPDAYHAPRGMLEFWVDPESPYHKLIFAKPDKEYIFYCAGGLRSALAAKAAKDCGVSQAAHMIGGYAAWQALGAEIESVKPKNG